METLVIREVGDGLARSLEVPLVSRQARLHEQVADLG
jgi:hypothetical protein